MPQTKKQKKETVQKIEKNIDEQKSIIFVSYKGLKAPDIFNFKKMLKEMGCSFLVAKKTLLNIAFKNKKIDFDAKELDGQIGLIFGFEDEINPAKAAFKFQKEKENLKILGGFFEEKIIMPENVIELAKIPSKQELLAKVVGSISSPISGFANVLQGNIRNLVYALSAIKK